MFLETAEPKTALYAEGLVGDEGPPHPDLGASEVLRGRGRQHRALPVVRGTIPQLLCYGRDRPVASIK